MGRLGEVLGGNMREDFIVVHLQEPCSMCRGHVSGEAQRRARRAACLHCTPAFLPARLARAQGPRPPRCSARRASRPPAPARAEPNAPIYRYHPTATSSKPPRERQFDGIKLEAPASAPVGPASFFQICQACYSEEATRQASGIKSRLPAGLPLGDLQLEAVAGVKPVADPDGPVDCEFFETRQAFLSLCQGNHYQFDTMRRAKHSSMMVLYHLHNPHAPAFSSTCNRCHCDIEPGNGLRCTVCSDFDMCVSCKQAGQTHEHPLVLQTANMDETQRRLSEQERQERMQSMQRTMALLVHACNCKNQHCPNPSCAKVKLLFSHAMGCPVRVTGGCALCRKMWFLLNLHAKSCMRADCNVPRCRELKELRRRQAQRMEAKRRVAYQAMLRNQAGLPE
jgi:E1A/CREB-binding protein